MPQPNYISDGTTPNRTDTKNTILTKWLGSLQNILGGNAANNPKRGDTKRTLEQKINRALQ